MYIILISTLFIVFHFLFDKIIGLKFISRIVSVRNNLQIFTGIYYGLITAAIQGFMYNIDPKFQVPIGLVICIAGILLKGWFSACMSLVSSGLICGLIFPITILSYIQFASVLSLIAIFEIIKVFVTPKHRVFYLLALVILFALLSWLTYSLTQNTFAFEQHVFENTWFIGIASFVFTSTVAYSIRFWVSLNILSESITYHFSRYLRLVVWESEVQNVIKTSKVDSALFILFKIQYENVKTREVEDVVLKRIENEIASDVMLFNFTENIYGFFFPTKINSSDIQTSLNGNVLFNRKQSDMLAQYEKIFQKVEAVYQDSENNVVKVSIKAGATIYGLFDSSFFLLGQQALFQIESIDIGKNIITLFEKNRHQTQLETYERIRLLDKAVNIDGFDLQIYPVYSPINKKTSFLVVEIDNTDFNSVALTRQHLQFNSWLEFFDRYFSMQILTQYATSSVKNKKLVIRYYSLSKIIVDIKEIIRKIQFLKLKPSNIIFAIEDFQDTLILKSNIEQLRQVQIGVAYIDPYIEALSVLPQPDLIIISPTSFDAKIDYNLESTIFSSISNAKALEKAIGHGAKMLCGKLVLEGNHFKEDLVVSNDLVDIAYDKFRRAEHE